VAETANHTLRSGLYRAAHGEPARVFESHDDAVRIEAYAFDFSMGEGQDLGYVLFTNGMSDRRMTLDEPAQLAFEAGEITPRAELAWYVRKPSPRYVGHLRWLAQFPFIDDTWIGSRHTVAMPEPLFERSELTAFFFLKPILKRHTRIAEAMRISGDPVELLVVHALTAPEYELKRDQGADAILDLFDAKGHALVLDERRGSYV